MNKLRFTILLAISLAGCASTQVGDRLYFGRAIPGDSTVSEAEWTTFLQDVVTPRFPEGLTIWRAQGQWQGGNGSVVREDVFVLEIFHDGDARSKAALQLIAEEYKRRFRQEAVLRITTPARMQFFEE